MGFVRNASPVRRTPPPNRLLNIAVAVADHSFLPSICPFEGRKGQFSSSGYLISSANKYCRSSNDRLLLKPSSLRSVRSMAWFSTACVGLTLMYLPPSKNRFFSEFRFAFHANDKIVTDFSPLRHNWCYSLKVPD